MIRGHDTAIDTRAEDLLGRARFADEIVRLVADLDADWTVRVGVYGPWGSGKSSILKMIAESLASREDIVVVQFNPWGYADAPAVLTALVTALAEQLTGKHDVHAANLKTHAGLTVLLDRLERLKGLHEYLTTASTVLGALVNGTLGSTEERSTRALGGASTETSARLRFVVTLDDLDRVRPEQILEITRWLQQLFDLKGFSFVVAMDPEMVAGALVASHAGYGVGGEAYLDKIIETARYVPRMTVQGQMRIAEIARDAHASFFPMTTLRQCAGCLPETPRAVRRLFRQLHSISEQARRYGDGELDYSLLFALAALQQDNRRTWELLVREQRLIGVVLAIEMESSDVVEGEFDRLCVDCDVTPKAKARIRRCFDIALDAVRRRAYDKDLDGHVRRHAELNVDPVSLTNAEARDLVELWGREPLDEFWVRLSELGEKWSSIEEVHTSLFAWCVAHYGEDLRTRQRVASTSESAAATERARQHLAVCQGLIERGRPELDDAFHALLLTVLGFWPSSSLGEIAPVHDGAQSLLKQMAQRIADPAAGLSRLLSTVDGRRDSDKSVVAYTEGLRNELSKRVAHELLDAFNSPSGIESMLYGSDPRKLVLSDPDGHLWSGAARSELDVVFASAAADDTIRGNALAVLLALADDLGRATPQMVRPLWKAATSAPIAHGYVARIVGARGALETALGGQLATPQWWEERCSHHLFTVRSEAACSESASAAALERYHTPNGVSLCSGAMYVSKYTEKSGIVEVAPAPQLSVTSIRAVGDEWQFRLQCEHPTLYGHGTLVYLADTLKLTLECSTDRDARTSMSTHLQASADQWVKWIAAGAPPIWDESPKSTR